MKLNNEIRLHRANTFTADLQDEEKLQCCQITPKSKILDHIEEPAWICQAAKTKHVADISTNLVLAWATSESLAFPLHNLDHSTEMRKPEPDLRNKNDRCHNPRKNRLSHEDKIRKEDKTYLVSSSSDSPWQKIISSLSTIEVLRSHSYPHS